MYKVTETSPSLNHLTLLIAREDFIKSIRRESIYCSHVESSLNKSREFTEALLKYYDPHLHESLPRFYDVPESKFCVHILWSPGTSLILRIYRTKYDKILSKSICFILEGNQIDITTYITIKWTDFG